MTLRVLIADDESMARKRLRRLLEALEDVEVGWECTNGEEVLTTIDEEAGVDVAFLDIRMPKLTGLDAAALLKPEGPALVFITAHRDYALDAFEVGAVDYLLKPLGPSRLQQCVDRLRTRKAEQVPALKPVRRLPVTTAKGVVLVDPQQISHASLNAELVTLVTPAQSFITDFSLSQLEAQLPQLRRVHRRVLLSLDHVEVLDPLPSGGYTARMKNGDLLPISRQAARQLRRELGIR